MEPVPYLIAITLGVLLVFGALWRFANKRDASDDDLPPNAIIVDGSNAMHWGGEPSAKSLVRVIDTLRKNDFNPIVIFDASVGYKLGDHYMDDPQMAKLIGLPAKHVLVVEKGRIADEIILEFAQESNLRIVTNDRFRDWFVKYKFIKQKGRLVRGHIKQGTVMMPTL